MTDSWRRRAAHLLCALVVLAGLLVGSGSASAASLRLRVDSTGQVHAWLMHYTKRGRLQFVLDGRTVRRTRSRAAWIKMRRRRESGRHIQWHRLVVRRNGSRRILAYARFGAYVARKSAPKLSLVGTPAASTSSTSAQFSFSTRSGSTSCSLDGAAFSSCSNQVTYNDLAPGNHTWVVTATNRYGSSSLSVAWTITTTTAPPPSSGGVSGQAMPVGDISGWHQVFADDFSADPSVPVGGLSGCVDGSNLMSSTCSGLPPAVAAKWWAYPDGWKDTSGHGTYSPSKVLSIQNGVLNY